MIAGERVNVFYAPIILRQCGLGLGCVYKAERTALLKGQPRMK